MAIIVRVRRIAMADSVSVGDNAKWGGFVRSFSPPPFLQLILRDARYTEMTLFGDESGCNCCFLAVEMAPLHVMRVIV